MATLERIGLEPLGRYLVTQAGTAARWFLIRVDDAQALASASQIELTLRGDCGHNWGFRQGSDQHVVEKCLDPVGERHRCCDVEALLSSLSNIPVLESFVLASPESIYKVAAPGATATSLDSWPLEALRSLLIETDWERLRPDAMDGVPLQAAVRSLDQGLDRLVQLEAQLAVLHQLCPDADAPVRDHAQKAYQESCQLQKVYAEIEALFDELGGSLDQHRRDQSQRERLGGWLHRLESKGLDQAAPKQLLQLLEIGCALAFSQQMWRGAETAAISGETFRQRLHHHLEKFPNWANRHLNALERLQAARQQTSSLAPPPLSSRPHWWPRSKITPPTGASDQLWDEIAHLTKSLHLWRRGAAQALAMVHHGVAIHEAERHKLRENWHRACSAAGIDPTLRLDEIYHLWFESLQLRALRRQLTALEQSLETKRRKWQLLRQKIQRWHDLTQSLGLPELTQPVTIVAEASRILRQRPAAHKRHAQLLPQGAVAAAVRPQLLALAGERRALVHSIERGLRAISFLSPEHYGRTQLRKIVSCLHAWSEIIARPCTKETLGQCRGVAYLRLAPDWSTVTRRDVIAAASACAQAAAVIVAASSEALTAELGHAGFGALKTSSLPPTERAPAAAGPGPAAAPPPRKLSGAEIADLLNGKRVPNTQETFKNRLMIS